MKIDRAIEVIKSNYPSSGFLELRKALDLAISALESSKNQEKPPFNCGYCKHLLRSDRTNKMFCTYHSEGGSQYVTYPDDYCSYFERSIAELEAVE